MCFQGKSFADFSLRRKYYTAMDLSKFSCENDFAETAMPDLVDDILTQNVLSERNVFHLSLINLIARCDVFNVAPLENLSYVVH